MSTSKNKVNIQNLRFTKPIPASPSTQPQPLSTRFGSSNLSSDSSSDEDEEVDSSMWKPPTPPELVKEYGEHELTSDRGASMAFEVAEENVSEGESGHEDSSEEGKEDDGYGLDGVDEYGAEPEPGKVWSEEAEEDEFVVEEESDVDGDFEITSTNINDPDTTNSNKRKAEEDLPQKTLPPKKKKPTVLLPPSSKPPKRTKPAPPSPDSHHSAPTKTLPKNKKTLISLNPNATPATSEERWGPIKKTSQKIADYKKRTFDETSIEELLQKEQHLMKKQKFVPYVPPKSDWHAKKVNKAGEEGGGALQEIWEKAMENEEVIAKEEEVKETKSKRKKVAAVRAVENLNRLTERTRVVDSYRPDGRSYGTGERGPLKRSNWTQDTMPSTSRYSVRMDMPRRSISSNTYKTVLFPADSETGTPARASRIPQSAWDIKTRNYPWLLRDGQKGRAVSKKQTFFSAKSFEKTNPYTSSSRREDPWESLLTDIILAMWKPTSVVEKMTKKGIAAKMARDLVEQVDRRWEREHYLEKERLREKQLAIVYANFELNQQVARGLEGKPQELAYASAKNISGWNDTLKPADSTVARYAERSLRDGRQY